MRLKLFSVRFVQALVVLLAAAGAFAAEVFDVVVVGSEPEGIAAAAAAAREGASVLLVTEHPRLGGLFVMGEMNSLDVRTSPVNYQRGLFLDWWKRVGKGHSFDVLRAEQAFE
ncbi:MAG TPA: FAD-dependent oxidoreductase, partial [Deinococcales bacterium]|nr:FAD-dependent oxidoreductase [Deinococcales bacterium]